MGASLRVIDKIPLKLFLLLLLAHVLTGLFELPHHPGFKLKPIPEIRRQSPRQARHIFAVTSRSCQLTSVLASRCSTRVEESSLRRLSV